MERKRSGEATEARRLRVRVTPNARGDAVIGFEEGVLRVRVRAPAVEGSANQAVLALLARIGGCRRGDIELLGGLTARNKLVSVPSAVADRLLAAARPSSTDAT